MHHRFFLIFMIAGAIIFSTACAAENSQSPQRHILALPKPSPTPPIVMQVNGVPILKETLDTQRAVWHQTNSPETDTGVIDTLIDRALIDSSATTLNIQAPIAEKMTEIQQSVSPEDMALWLERNHLTPEAFEIQLRAELQALAVFDAVTADVPTAVPQIHARCLQFPSEDAAQTAIERLSGGESFAALGAEFGCTPESRRHGGDLGWFPAGIGILPADIEQIAFTMQPDSTSGVLPAGETFFVLKVVSAAAERPLTPAYHYQMRVNAFQQWLAHQRASATIERIAN